MHLKFSGVISGYTVKENKDLGKVVVIAFTTELTRSLAELAMMYGTSVTVEIDHFAWETETRTAKGQYTIDTVLSEECAICGHQKGWHKLDPNVCLGDDGMCPCSGFVGREQAAKEAPGETAEALDELEPLPDEIHCSCGHLRSDHDPVQGCLVNVITGEVDGEIGVHTCQCVRVFLEDGTPDGLVGDHDGEGKIPLQNTICGRCGHQLQFHADDLGCSVNIVDGYPVATCDCAGFMPQEAGAPGYDYDLSTEADIEEAEAAVLAEETAGDLCSQCGHLKVAHTVGFGCMAVGFEGQVCTCAHGFFAATYPVEGDGNALVGEEKPKRGRPRRKAEEADQAQVA